MNLKEYIKSLIREMLDEGNKNTHNIILTFTDQRYIDRFKTTPTFGKMLAPNQMNTLKVGDNKLIVNNVSLNGLERMASMGLYTITKDINEQEGGAVGNTTAAVPGYMTPKAFSPKGQKKNIATKTAEKQGMKVTKGETTMPSDSKVRDYKSLWSSAKKKGVKIYEEEGSEFEIGDKVKYENQEWEIINIFPDGRLRLEKQPSPNIKTNILPSKAIKISERSNYDQASNYGAASGFTAASGYTGASLATKGGGYYASAVKENKMNLNDIIDQELLNEETYHKFKNEVKYRTKAEQLHKAIREVKRKLQEIDRIVEYTQRMKQELSEGDGIQYWNRTNKAVATISEMINKLNNKIKNLNQ